MIPYMKCFHDHFGFYPEGYEVPSEDKDDYNESPIFKKGRYRPCYPDNWYIPKTQYEKGMDRLSWTPIRYTPYRRISHFREHLNRLQYSQFVSIPPLVFNILQPFFRDFQQQQGPSPPLSTEMYFIVKIILKQHQCSQYNEHIHYLISFFHQTYLDISYDDFHKMCDLFRELEIAYQNHAFFNQNQHRPRKNFMSYYLIVQFILYLFHYHPNYRLPTLMDSQKRGRYYVILLDVFAQTHNHVHLIEQHFKRKKQCCACQTTSCYFDSDLLELL